MHTIKGLECNELVDVRYFPHYQNIEFYSEYTDEKPLYVENIGYSVIYVQSSAGTIKLAPGERKEVTPENTEKRATCSSGWRSVSCGGILIYLSSSKL